MRCTAAGQRRVLTGGAQLSHTLENAIAAAQSRVAKVADSRGPVPGFDCSLEELNETFTEGVESL